MNIMKILIVDDDLSSMNKMETILGVLGPCITADCGTKALHEFQEALSSEEPFDLITLDIDMPDINGIDVLKKIRTLEAENKISKSNRSRIIMVSGKSDKDSLITCMKAGCDNFIVKPFDITTLIEKMDQIEISYDKTIMSSPRGIPGRSKETLSSAGKIPRQPDERLRILIVDDDDVSRQKMEAILDDIGDCTTVTSGQEAITLFITAMQQKKPFHLIMLDYSMPEWSGVETLSHMRKIESSGKTGTGKSASIIMVTSHSDKENVITCLKAGCNEYIVKPFNRETVIQRLTKLKVIDPPNPPLSESAP
ncbi:MAG: response regulator [Desulfobacteraceae bacterium]|nr:MAG: response regulator [Desulfobacteraceae bacterium]